MLASVNRTDSTDEWNGLAGITCLTPTNHAFEEAGSPDITAPETGLNSILDAHTIDGAVYTTGLQSGQILQSQANATIVVTIIDGTVYFNNAKVLRANVVTNNGVAHVLDSVR
jgi:uncharacterized surface protein with fasciclin (FAS1) repeats